MEVTIKETVYQYKSDYPGDNWKTKNVDAFNPGAEIGGHACFIKRFSKATSTITGWKLLEDLNGKNIPNLARIYSIGSEHVHGSKIPAQYIFYKFIAGRTLTEQVAKKIRFDLIRFTEDLFTGLRGLQEWGHWFPDFCEDNIFVGEGEKFYLIDLDSAQPMKDRPEDLYGNKDYWILVTEFYTKVLKMHHVRPSQFNGSSFNYLHAVFLVLRLRLFYLKNAPEYERLFDQLPHDLNNIAPAFKEIFRKVYDKPDQALDLTDIAEIKALVMEKIIPLTDYDFTEIKVAPPPPVNIIHSFRVAGYPDQMQDEYSVTSGRPFTLEWDLQLTEGLKVELLRNDSPYKTVDNTKNNLEITEKVYDSDNKMITFVLVVTNEKASPQYVEEKSIKIIVTKDPKARPINIQPETEPPEIGQFSTNKKTIRNEGDFVLTWLVKGADTITLHKNGFPVNTFEKKEENISIHEKYEGETKHLQYFIHAANSNGIVKSAELHIAVKPAINIMKLVLIALGAMAILALLYFLFLSPKDSGSTEIYPAQIKEIFSGNAITVLGKNIPEKDTSVTIKFNRIKATILTISKDSIRAIVPDLAGSVNDVNIVANIRGSAYLVAEQVSYHRSANFVAPVLFPFSSFQLKAGDTITIKGSGLSQADTAIQVFINEVNAAIILRTADSLHAIVPSINGNTVNVKIHFNNIDTTLANGISYLHPDAAASSITVDPITRRVLNEGEFISITGSNFPKRAKIRVKFNGSFATITQKTGGLIKVQVPSIAGVNTVNVSVLIDDESFTAGDHVRYQPVPVTIFSSTQTDATEGNSFFISGKKIPTHADSVEVRFNNVTAKITALDNESIKIQIPTLLAGTTEANVTVQVNGKSYPVATMTYHRKEQIVKQKTNLCQFAVPTTDTHKSFFKKTVAEITLKNTSPAYTLEAVIVTIHFIKDGDDKTETMEFNNIKPGEATSKKSKTPIKGAAVSVEVNSVKSRELGLQNCK